jgi:integrase/recombinase XerD
MTSPEHQPTTLAPLIREYLADRRAVGVYTNETAKTVRRRFVTLDAHFGHRPLHRLTARALHAWLSAVEHLSPNSRAAYMSSVRMFTRWLVEQGHLAVDPCASLPPLRRRQPVPRAQSPDAVARLLATCTDNRDRAIAWLMVGLGLRRCEVSRARWEDYDHDARTLLVHGKGGKERLLPVPDTVMLAMERLREGHRFGPITRSYNTGAALSPQSIGRIISELFAVAGLKHGPWDGVSGHALRHTAASDVFEACHDLRVVQAMLGHSQLSSTAIYLRRANIGQLRTAMEGRTYRSGEVAAS